MSSVRTIAGISAIICVIGLTAIGQQEETPHQTDHKTELERCKAAMPIILKNYNNAKYAVFLARNTGPDAAGVLDRVATAQAALDAMEQPLKVCSEAMQNVQSEQQPSNTK